MPQGLLDVEKSKWEVAWIIASQPPLTLTQAGGGVRVEVTVLLEEYDRHLEVSRRSPQRRRRLTNREREETIWPARSGEGHKMASRR